MRLVLLNLFQPVQAPSKENSLLLTEADKDFHFAPPAFPTCSTAARRLVSITDKVSYQTRTSYKTQEKKRSKNLEVIATQF